MTRMEAIEWLKSIKNKYISGGDDWFDHQRRQAIDYAVEHLASAVNIKNKPVIYCQFCKGRAYTKKPVIIITAYGKRFQMVFEHCPNCGRKLRTEDGK